MSYVARLLTRTAAVVAPAGLALALAAGPAASADDWGTLIGFGGNRIQACKVPVGDGRAWRIRLRVVAGDTPARGRVVVVNGQGRTDRRWRSGEVHRHDFSPTGSVRLHRGPRWSLDTEIETSEGGAGGSGSDGSDVNRC